MEDRIVGFGEPWQWVAGAGLTAWSGSPNRPVVISPWPAGRIAGAAPRFPANRARLSRSGRHRRDHFV